MDPAEPPPPLHFDDDDSVASFARKRMEAGERERASQKCHTPVASARVSMTTATGKSRKRIPSEPNRFGRRPLSERRRITASLCVPSLMAHFGRIHRRNNAQQVRRFGLATSMACVRRRRRRTIAVLVFIVILSRCYLAKRSPVLQCFDFDHRTLWALACDCLARAPSRSLACASKNEWADRYRAADRSRCCSVTVAAAFDPAALRPNLAIVDEQSKER